MTRQTLVMVLVCAVVVGGIWCGQALAISSATQPVADSGAGQAKTGTVKSVDAKAKTFVLDLPTRPLTMTVNDKTVITLDGKASTFEAAIKVGAKVSVAYTKDGDNRIATKIEAGAADSVAGETKTGTVKSVDVKAKTFVLEREPRPMTMTVNDKTVITLDGKASTFEAAIKVDAKVSVTYTKAGDTRTATKVEVTTAEKKEEKKDEKKK